jgi:uncharacterized protein (DUF58 family)
MSALAVDMPKVETLLRRVHALEVRVNRLLDAGLAGAYRSVFRGRGIEAEGLREYSFADDAARIDWQVSARANRPCVRVYREERELVCLLLVDVSGSMRCAAPGPAARSAAADLAALLALAAVHNRDRVGLLLFSTQMELWLPPARSREHALRLIRDVACHEPVTTGTDTGLALRTAARLAPQRSLIFLISDMAAGVSAVEVARLTRRHELVVLHLGHSQPPLLPPARLLWLQDAETGRCVPTRPSAAAAAEYCSAAAQRAAEARAAVRSGGGEWVDVPTDGDALAALAQFLTRRARRARAGRSGVEATG